MDTGVTFESVVTLDCRLCHQSCYRVQLNRFVRDGKSTEPGTYWKDSNGAEASTSGTCGSARTWGHCTLSIQNGNPVAPRNFAQPAQGTAWRPLVHNTVLNAVQQAVGIATGQIFKDGNHRTALITMFEIISSAGLHIMSKVDVFRLYVIMKSLTDDVGEFPKMTRADAKALMIKLMEDVVVARVVVSNMEVPVTFFDRVWLARAAKYDVARQLQEVFDFKVHVDGEIRKAVDDEAKRRVLRNELRAKRNSDGKMFARFTLLYPTYTSYAV
ncbi:hypothetical protein DL96DRAFT_1712566 [Flagelloscypha sp. PMI_526]|nr:hypothetical protein DL96DRAFT_1712566 [Flagelloscypha sp. PMI_526]